MTGGHVQGDLLAPEDVVSLLLDDAQLEQKLREIPLQVRFNSDRVTVRLLLCDRKVTGSSSGNSLFAKSKGKAAYINNPPPTLTKRGALCTGECPLGYKFSSFPSSKRGLRTAYRVYTDFYVLCSLKAKDRQKKKQPTKGIWLDAEGDASLEDLTNTGAQGTEDEPSPDPEKAKSSNKKVLKLI